MSFLRYKAWLLAAGLCLLLAGCGVVDSMVEKQQAVDWRDANFDYVLRLRWKDWTGLASHLQPELRKELLDRIPATEDMKITDAALVRMEGDLPAGKVEATYRIEYYWLPSVTVHSFQWDQTWTLVGSRSWMVSTPLPEFPKK